MDKSPQRQYQDLQAGREEGRRRASSGTDGPWSANPDYARGIDEGRRDHDEARQTEQIGGGLVGFVLVAFAFIARGLWHAVSNPGEALLHYGAFALAKDWISEAFAHNDLVVIAASLGLPILAIASFNHSLMAIRRAEIEADYIACRIHPALGWLLFYALMALTIAAGWLLVSLGRRGDVVPLIVIDMPVNYALAAVTIVPLALRLFAHPLAFRYNPLLGR